MVCDIGSEVQVSKISTSSISFLSAGECVCVCSWLELTHGASAASKNTFWYLWHWPRTIMITTMQRRSVEMEYAQSYTPLVNPSYSTYKYRNVVVRRASVRSHVHETDTESECVCVCVCACV